MSIACPCLTPACIPVDLYKGHPLFFYFLSSIWMKYLGSDPAIMHSLMLLIALAGLGTFYLLAKKFVPEKWALLAVGVLMLQEVFIVQSGLVLPEVLLMLLTVLCFLAYFEKKKVLFIISASLLVLTKEIGLLAVFIIYLHHVITHRKLAIEDLWLIAGIIPGLVFYLLQFSTTGWVFYPQHLELASNTMDSLVAKTQIVLHFMFLEQGRIFWYTSIITYIIISSVFSNNKIKLNSSDRRFFNLAGLFIAVTLPFIIYNFLMLRYTLLLFPFIILIVIILLHKLSANNNRLYIAASLITFGIFASSLIYNYNCKTWHDDASLNYVNAIATHKRLANFCQINNWNDREILTHFLMQQNLKHPVLGYVKGAGFGNVDYVDTGIQGQAEHPDFKALHPDYKQYDIVIFSNIEFDEGRHNSIRSNPAYKLAYEVKTGNAWGEIYVTADLPIINSE